MSIPISSRFPRLDKLRIIPYPDPVLKRRCLPVREFDSGLSALAERMLALMRQAKGVGLAAPQVGVSIRLFVCNATGEPGDDLVFVNPRLLETAGLIEAEEGCLSIPGVTVTMRRANQVVVEAMDTSGRVFQRTAEQLLARVIQHENDHLDGRLITDSMSATEEIANRRALRQLEADYAAASKRRKRRSGGQP